MSENDTPSATDDSSTDTEHTTDVHAAVIDAIQHLEGHADPGDGWDDSQEFQMKAAHDRLAHLDASDAARDAAETIRDVVDLLAETPNVPADECGVIAQTALAQLAPLAARTARRRASTYGSPEDPTEPLGAVVTARDTLQTISFDDVGDETTSRLINALEPLDNILIDASRDEFARIGSTELETETTAGDGGRTVSDPIPETTDDVERIKDPTAAERAQAKRDYGDDCLPGVGPIPNPRPSYQVPVDITLPKWILEVVAGRIEDLDDPNRVTVEGHIMDYAMANERFLTPDGRDAFEVLLEEYRDEDS